MINDFALYRYPAWTSWCGNITLGILVYTFVTCSLNTYITTPQGWVLAVGAVEWAIIVIFKFRFRAWAYQDAASKNLDLTKVRFL